MFAADRQALVFTDLVLLVEPIPENPAKLLVVVRPIILGEGTVHTVPNTGELLAQRLVSSAARPLRHCLDAALILCR